jgi:hypothetical protein
MKMEHLECSETLTFKLQTPGNHPEESIQHEVGYLRAGRWMVMYLIFVHLIPCGGIVFMQHIHNDRVRSEGVYCSWVRLLIHRRWEQETYRCFEFVTLIGWRSGVGFAWSPFLCSELGLVALQAVIFVFVFVQFGTAEKGGARRLFYKLLYSLCYSEISCAVDRNCRRWFRKGNEMDSDYATWNMICVVA